jgi:hypothetical protein
MTTQPKPSAEPSDDLREKVGCRITITIDDIGSNREFVAEFLKLCARFYPFAQKGQGEHYSGTSRCGLNPRKRQGRKR